MIVVAAKEMEVGRTYRVIIDAPGMVAIFCSELEGIGETDLVFRNGVRLCGHEGCTFKEIA